VLNQFGLDDRREHFIEDPDWYDLRGKVTDHIVTLEE
jgi:hypothetical protein